jgi:hypothetical protein
MSILAEAVGLPLIYLTCRMLMIITDDWMDNSRDILNFLINYLPSTAIPSVLPVHLPRLPEDESESRKVRGYQDRILAAVGHSFGGCTVYISPSLSCQQFADPSAIQIASCDQLSSSFFFYCPGRSHYLSARIL